MKRGHWLLVATAALSLMLLSGCGAGEPPDASETSPEISEPGPEQNPIQDVAPGEAELHEEILPLEFEEGESVDNPFYKRTTNVDGVPCYAVLKTNGQMAYLPMDATVCYVTSSGPSYYERIKLTYTLNGEEVEKDQWQLFINMDGQEPAEGAEDETVSPAN